MFLLYYLNIIMLVAMTTMSKQESVHRIRLMEERICGRDRIAMHTTFPARPTRPICSACRVARSCNADLA